MPTSTARVCVLTDRDRSDRSPLTSDGPDLYLRRTWHVPATDLACTSPVDAGDGGRAGIRATGTVQGTRSMSPADSVGHGNQHGTRLNHSPQKNAGRRMQVAGCGEGGPASLRTRTASHPTGP
jgi:hypothetical protein